MKKANLWITGAFLLIVLFNLVDAAMPRAGCSFYLSLVYFAGFTICLILTRKSKACNLFYLIYSFILCVAVILSFMPSLLFAGMFSSCVYFLAMMLINPIICFASLLWGGPDPLLWITGIVLLYLFPFLTMGVSFHFFTKNHCE